MTTKEQVPKKHSFGRAQESAAFSIAMLGLAAQSPERLNLNQLAFFAMAASADLAGRPATLGELLEAAGSRLGLGVRTSYRILTKPSRRYPDALGWLVQEQNPDDERSSFLRLSDKGRAVFFGALDALRGEA